MAVQQMAYFLIWKLQYWLEDQCFHYLSVKSTIYTELWSWFKKRKKIKSTTCLSRKSNFLGKFQANHLENILTASFYQEIVRISQRKKSIPHALYTVFKGLKYIVISLLKGLLGTLRTETQKVKLKKLWTITKVHKQKHQQAKALEHEWTWQQWTVFTVLFDRSNPSDSISYQ